MVTGLIGAQHSKPASTSERRSATSTMESDYRTFSEITADMTSYGRSALRRFIGKDASTVERPFDGGPSLQVKNKRAGNKLRKFYRSPVGLEREVELGDDKSLPWASSNGDETLDEKEIAQRGWANKMERLKEMDRPLQQMRDSLARVTLDQEKPDEKTDPGTATSSDKVYSNDGESWLDESRPWPGPEEWSKSPNYRQGEGVVRIPLGTIQEREPTGQEDEDEDEEEEQEAESADEELPQHLPQTDNLHLLHTIQKHHQLQRFRHLHLELLAHPLLIARTVPNFLPADDEPVWSPRITTTIVPYTPSAPFQLSIPSQTSSTHLRPPRLFSLPNIIPLAGALIALVFGVFAALSYNLSTTANQYAEKSLHQTLIQNELALLAFCWASDTANATDGSVAVSAVCARVLAAATAVLPGAAAEVFTTADATTGVAVNATRSSSSATVFPVDERLGVLIVVAVWTLPFVRRAW